MGQKLRAEALETRSVRVTLSGLTAGSFRLQTFAVDDTRANAYRAREDLQDELDRAGTDEAALAALARRVRNEYGPDSTGVLDSQLNTSDGEATVAIDMTPNSVWLVVLTAR
jgi:hypothetical protein